MATLLVIALSVGLSQRLGQTSKKFQRNTSAPFPSSSITAEPCNCICALRRHGNLIPSTCSSTLPVSG